MWFSNEYGIESYEKCLFLIQTRNARINDTKIFSLFFKDEEFHNDKDTTTEKMNDCEWLSLIFNIKFDTLTKNVYQIKKK